MKEVNPDTIGQYTGLTDKNGKNIFEGDIVNFKITAHYFKKCKIKYQNHYTRYCAIDNKGYEYPVDESFEYEIIGNIFDNPELLRGDTKRLVKIVCIMKRVRAPIIQQKVATT